MVTTLTEAHQAWRSQQSTASQVTQNCIKKIHSRTNLCAFLGVYESEALAEAARIDRIAPREAGRLAGSVIGLKDVLCYQDHPLSAASRVLEGFMAQFTGTAVRRLLDQDAIVIGRQNCDEFAMGSSNENSAYGAARNAADPTRVPGGSSGGSAVAVQAGMCLASLGSDTGGSVRQPAAFCGIVGLKPTYGRVSRYGLTAYASSFDCIGYLTRTVADAALLLELTAGADEHDSTVSHEPTEPYTERLAAPSAGRIAVVREGLMSEAVDPDVRSALKQRIAWLRTQGYEVDVIDLPLLDYMLPAYYILTTAEAGANLARYDGVKYGYRAETATDLTELYRKSRSEGFGREVKRRIMLGTFVLSAGYQEAYYTQAQRVRRLIARSMHHLLRTYDYLMLPTTPTTAFRMGERTEDPITMYLADLFTVPASLAGLPAISVPEGIDRENLPIGLQVVTGPFQEAKLLAFAQYLEHNR